MKKRMIVALIGVISSVLLAGCGGSANAPAVEDKPAQAQVKLPCKFRSGAGVRGHTFYHLKGPKYTFRIKTIINR